MLAFDSTISFKYDVLKLFLKLNENSKFSFWEFPKKGNKRKLIAMINNGLFM
jgi:hypothetical protein